MAALAHRASSLVRSVRAVSGESSVFKQSLSGAPATGGAGDDVLKAVFVRQQNNFRTYLEEIAKTKLVLDPSIELKHHFDTQNQIRTKLGLPSYTQKIADLLEPVSKDAPDLRTYLNIHSTLHLEVGIEDDSGADKLLIDELDKVQKTIGKSLLKDDAASLAVWKKELDQINQKLGIDDSMLEKLDEISEDNDSDTGRRARMSSESSKAQLQ